MIVSSAFATRAGLVGPLLRRIPSIQHALAFRLRASDPNAGSAEAGAEDMSAGASSSSTARRVPPPPRPIPQGMRLERVERLGDEAWGGVAKVDRTTLGAVSIKDRIILATGDVAALTIFATIGRASHHESLSLLDSLGTAAPFIIGWVGAPILLGGYTKSAVDSPRKTAASAWITGIPSGLVIRSLLKGHVPETAFIAISMAFTGVFLIGWRSVYAKYFSSGGSVSVANKRGNPFEFLSLLFSLTKRW